MVTYMGKQQKRNLRNGLIGGIATLGILSVLSYGLLRGENDDFSSLKSLPSQTLTQVQQPYNTHSVLVEEFQNDLSPQQQSYAQLTKIVFEGFEKNPEYANQAIRKGLEALSFENAPIEKSTYLAMFDEIKNKAETTPEIMDHFGNRAQLYMEKKFLDKYMGVVHDSFGDTIREVKEHGKQTLDFFNAVKEYFVEPSKEAP